MRQEENGDAQLLREWRDVQIWRVNYTPTAHARFRVANYVVQVVGGNAEAFRLPSAAWERYENLCAAQGQRRTLPKPAE